MQLQDNIKTIFVGSQGYVSNRTVSSDAGPVPRLFIKKCASTLNFEILPLVLYIDGLSLPAPSAGLIHQEVFLS